MRLSVLAGLYVAVVLSAQIGAQKKIELPIVHLTARGGVYSIGVALALVPGQEFDSAAGSTWRIVAASPVAFLASETVDNLVGAPLR
ncbi:MAG TPA: hypothetical protein VKO84_07525 [Gaiellaceae bacterium]|nr:hypothetical protein [Gaiellaceae bacterium]